jgi:hypothetical protein
VSKVLNAEITLTKIFKWETATFLICVEECAGADNTTGCLNRPAGWQHGVCNPPDWTLDRRFPLLREGHDHNRPRRAARRHLPDVDNGVGAIRRAAVVAGTPFTLCAAAFRDAAWP